MPQQTVWTPERDSELRSLAAQNFSGRQIAKRLNCSRNAVMGRAHRLGISCGGHPGWRQAWTNIIRKMDLAGHIPESITKALNALNPPEPISLRTVLSKITNMRASKANRRARNNAKRFTSPHPTVARERIPASPKGILLVNLEPNHCRYIPGAIEGANTLYCGADIEPGKPYCPSHCAACYQQ